jgi:NAD(P)-dependent dehydrogenase (short-subunit alcohol dehydrogenase family)
LTISWAFLENAADMNIDFNGKIALVTGGTKGIGKQIADDLLQLGADVYVTGTSAAPPQDLSGRTERYLGVDFTNRADTERFLDVVGKMERVDICINNAGINRINPIDETLVEDWDDISAVNLDAPFLVTRCVSKIMKANHYGRIINISSIFGVISKAKRALYSMSKFGLRGLTVSSAIDLAPYNILVNTVSPGFVMTDLTQRILGPVEMERMAKEVPMGRFAQPEEISRAVLFLASDLNSYITGQNLIIDGGFINV